MFEKIINFFKNIKKVEDKNNKSKDAAKERLHLVLMQDRANVSADFLELMKQEIIDVIKKYIEIDENAIDVRLTNKTNDDGTNGAPALYANIPIASIKNDIGEVAKLQKKEEQNNTQIKEEKEEDKKGETKKDDILEEIKEAEEIKEKVETEIEENKEQESKLGE